jgi:hypothetical protein
MCANLIHSWLGHFPACNWLTDSQTSDQSNSFILFPHVEGLVSHFERVCDPRHGFQDQDSSLALARPLQLHIHGIMHNNAYAGFYYTEAFTGSVHSIWIEVEKL